MTWSIPFLRAAEHRTWKTPADGVASQELAKLLRLLYEAVFRVPTIPVEIKCEGNSCNYYSLIIERYL